MIKFLDAIAKGSVKVKLSDDDKTFIKEKSGWDNARNMLSEAIEKKDSTSKKKITHAKIRTQMAANYKAIIKEYPIFSTWPQVLKTVMKVRYLMFEIGSKKNKKKTECFLCFVGIESFH